MDPIKRNFLSNLIRLLVVIGLIIFAIMQIRAHQVQSQYEKTHPTVIEQPSPIYPGNYQVNPTKSMN
jgi:hypothetical protein